MHLKFSYLLALFCAGLLLFICSKFNLGISPDSISYIDVARNLIKGKGFVDYGGNLVQHWPPGYPLALAFFAKVFNSDVLEIGKFLNAILLLLSGVLFAHCLNAVKINRRLHISFLVFFIISIPLVYFYYFLSEGLFITLLMAVILLFLKYVKRPKRSYLILAGTFCGLLMITRYSGIGFILGFTLVLMFFPAANFKKRVISVLLYCIPIILIFGSWLWYISKFANFGSSRSINWHLISLGQISHGFYTYLSWLFYPKLIFGLFILSIIYFIYDKLHLIKLGEVFLAEYKWESRILIIPVLTYLFFIIISISFIYKNINFNNRILSPTFPFIFLFIAILFNCLNKENIRGKWVFRGFFLLLIFNVIFRLVPKYVYHYNNGLLYSNREWMESESLEYARGVDQKMIFTNSPEILTHHSIFSVESIPFLFSPGTTMVNSRKEQDIINLKDQIRDEEAQLIYFDRVDWRYYLVSREELLQLFKGEEIVYFKDGFCIR